METHRFPAFRNKTFKGNNAHSLFLTVLFIPIYQISYSFIFYYLYLFN